MGSFMNEYNLNVINDVNIYTNIMLLTRKLKQGQAHMEWQAC